MKAAKAVHPAKAAKVTGSGRAVKIVKGAKAVIGRPPENVLTLID